MKEGEKASASPARGRAIRLWERDTLSGANRSEEGGNGIQYGRDED